MDKYLLAVIIGTLIGLIVRVAFLRTDIRQYATYPTGRNIHLSFGFIAAFIGTLAITTVIESDCTVVTFLGLAATQFREVRSMERETLEKIDEKELIKRGDAFIEGIAQAFESRNYFVMFVSMITTLISVYNIWLGMIGGIVSFFVSKFLIIGKMFLRMVDISVS